MDELWDMLDADSLPEQLVAGVPEQLVEGELETCEDCADAVETLREVLHEDYEDAPPEELDEALVNILESLAPAESFNFSKALLQAGKSATRAVEHPAVAQIATTALPVVGGAVGTTLAPGVGTGLGTGLGQAAAKALAARGKPRTAPAPPAAKTPLAAGSPAAATGFLLTQQPYALKGLLSAALGEHGRKRIDGVPVSAVMNLLSAVFAQAAAEADELRRSSEPPAYLHDAEGNLRVDPVAPADRARALYAELVAAENEELAEAVGLV